MINMTKSQITKLVQELQKADEAYYVKARSVMTDEVYDKKRKLLAKVDPKNPYLKKVRTEVSKELKGSSKEVAYPVPAPSLDKVYPATGELERFQKKNANVKSWVLMDKLDGISLVLEYTGAKDGWPTMAITGGDQRTGTDVSHLIPHIKGIKKLPRTNMVIRGELIMSKTKFKTWAKKYANARNLAGGVLNKKKGGHEALGDVHFIAYEIMQPRTSPSSGLSQLEALGFDVVWNKEVLKLTDTSLSLVLKNRREKSPFEIDGIVVANNAKFPAASTNPKYAMAFKEEDARNFANATVISVEWNVSKLGRLKPRINIKPVKLAGVTVEWVTGHNAKTIKDGKIGPGAVISVTRSGEVIPFVVGVVKPAKAQMPDEFDWHWNENKVEAYVDDDASDVMLAKQIHSFLKDGLGVKHLAVKSIMKCIEVGIDSIEEFLTAKPKRFTKVEGVKEATANKWVAEIHNGLAKADMAKIAGTSGFFGENFGEKRVQKIMNAYDLRKLARLTPKEIYAQVLTIPGFKEKTAKPFAKGLRSFIKWVDSVGFEFKAVAPVKITGAKLKDKIVVFTGFRDKDMEQLIKEQGGTVGSGVTGKTDILLIKAGGKASTKVDKAKALGVKVMYDSDFMKKFG